MTATTKPPPAAYQPPLRATSGAKPKASRWYALLAIAILSIGFLLPFLWMASTALKTNPEAMAEKFTPLPPSGPHFENLKAAMTDERFDAALFTRNTLIIAVLTVLGTTVSSAFAAYGFSKIRFKGRGVLFGVMLATMMIPFPVIMVSMFVLWRFLGDHTGIQFLGTFKPFWVPAFFGSAFNIFLLRQFFITIPDELSEAARIDGCSELGIFVRIILPLARPALAVVALFAFMGAWNDFLMPLIYIQHPQYYTLALGLQTFQSQHGGTTWNLLMAASLLVLAPIIILFFLVQKTFIQGIATTGMKG